MIIKIVDVEVYYNSTPALKNATLELREGEMSFIIGPNGSGKTTLLKTIANLVKPRRGVVYIDGKEIYRYSPTELGKLIGFADPYINKSLPATVLDLLTTARYPHENSLSMSLSRESLEIIEEITDLLNIRDLLSRRIDQLSSGELQRVLLARVLVQRPRILLLDEPSAFLDLRYRLETLDLVEKYTKRDKLVSVVAIHDMYLASLYADKIILVDKGEIVAAGRPSDILKKDLLEKIYGVEIAEITMGSKKIFIPIKSISG